MSLARTGKWESRRFDEIFPSSSSYRIVLQPMLGEGIDTPIDELAYLALMTRILDCRNIFDDRHLSRTQCAKLRVEFSERLHCIHNRPSTGSAWRQQHQHGRQKNNRAKYYRNRLSRAGIGPQDQAVPSETRPGSTSPLTMGRRALCSWMVRIITPQYAMIQKRPFE